MFGSTVVPSFKFKGDALDFEQVVNLDDELCNTQ